MAKINYTFYDNNDIYNDGDVEADLLKFYSKEKDIDVEDERYFFYTTKIRENIINWYPFKENAKILEIGAGVGTVTGALLKSAKKVVSVEGSKRRSEVIYNRHSDANNLEVFCGNFGKMKFDEKFDYVVLIGVFEYSELFFDSTDPFGEFIEKIKSVLNKNGKIIIAIENKLGIKYFSGFSEDHCRKPFVGLEGYEKEKVKTFGKKEFNDLMNKHGLCCNFFGVFPDYKLPNFIFNEDYKILNHDLTNYINYNYYNDLIMFDDKKVLKTLNNNDLSIDFANSFIVEITENDNDFCKVDYVRFQNTRTLAYQVATVLSKDDVIRKIPLTPDAINHLDRLVEVHKNLNKLNIKCCDIYKENNYYVIEKIKGNNLLEEINLSVKENDEDRVVKLLDDYVKFLNGKSKIVKSENLLHESLECYGDELRVLPYALLDLHFDNIFLDGDDYVLIDQEWWDERLLPIDYNIYINLNVLYHKIPSLNKFYNIYYFYDRYNLNDKKIDSFVKTNRYFFYEYKKFVNEKVSNLLESKSKTEIVDRDDLSLVRKADFNETLVDFYKAELEKVKAERDSYISALNNKQTELANYNHRIYRWSERLLDILYILFPYNTKRRKFAVGCYKFIRKLIRFLLKIFRVIVKLFFKIIPSKKLKRKISRRMRRSKTGSRILAIPYNSVSTDRLVIDDDRVYPVSNLLYIDKSIAVHLHLFYTDLAKEFYNYLSNIPYNFDLYVSVPRGVRIRPLKRLFKKILNVNKVIIRYSENSGRDYGPMFVLFKNELKNYDYLLHIHSKKSLRTGVEQEDWRRYLLNNLIGSSHLVMQYFNLLLNYNVGIAYPDTYPGCTYLSHTYLGVKGLASQFYSKLGLNYSDSYVNFSAGSMFWCDVNLIRDLFELDLTWDDFGAEHGQDDGTLEYVMERIYDPLVRKKKMNYLVFNPRNNHFYLNYANKSLEQYYKLDKNKLFDKLESYPIVTFDIFDTLVTRKVYNPDDIFRIIDTKVSNIFNVEAEFYIKLRKEAESQVRVKKNFVGDCTIDEIYEEMCNNSILSESDMMKIKEIEIETDLESIIPRKEMLDVYNKLLKKNKQIILISDMYYTKDIIKKILSNCGYDNYYELFVSSELGFRKDNGTMWDYFYERYDNSIHVGDNEESDIHLLMNRNKPCIHVMQGRKMYENSRYYSDSDEKLENVIMKGLIVNKSLFNSPFALNNKLDGGAVNNFYDYGYSVLAPVFLYFFSWLNKTLSSDAEILFVSREGHYLQKIYKHFISKSNNSERNNCYFLTSRRAVSVTNIKSLDDVREIFESVYKGSLYELFYHRLGIMLNKKYKNENIELPRDIDKVMVIAEENFQKIKSIARKDRNNYLKYVNSVIDLSSSKEFVVVDLGYSGSVQYELSKLLERKISGAYFVVSNSLKPLSIGAKVYSCFNSITYDDSFLKCPISKYSVIFESFLTGPTGQLLRFDNNIQPVYLEENDKLELMRKLDIVYNGICDFISDMADMNIKDITDLNLDKDYILNNFANFIKSGNLNSEIRSTFKVEDFYCSNGNIKF